MNTIITSGNFITSTTDTPINARSRINSITDIPTIENPAIGEIFYCIENKTLYVITGLKSKTVAGITLQNAAIDTYTPVCQGGDNAFTVDSELSDTSTNPVENRVISAQFQTVTESIDQTNINVNTLQAEVTATASKVDTVVGTVSNKQDKLISGTNIKTVNGKSLLGEGDIEIVGTADIDLDDTVTEDSSNAVTSAGIFQAIVNKVDGKFKVLTQTDYNGMESHDSKTFYFILK